MAYGENVRAVPGANQLRFVVLRVGKEKHRCGDKGDNGNNYYPKGGAFVVKHPFNSVLNTYLTKGKRTGGNKSAVCRAAYKGVGIGLFVLLSQGNYRLFICRYLNIPAKQYVSHPKQRVKPVDAKQQEPKRLPQMVTSFKVRPLVGNNVLLLLLRKAFGQVYFGSDNAQNEGGSGVAA